MGDAGDGRRPARPDPRRAARLDRHAPERDRRRGDRPLVLPAARRSATGSSTRRRTSRRCATSTRRSPDLEVVAVEDDAAIVDAIDERTLLVPISHVLFKNGEIQDVEPIVRRAHEVGAHVVLDCYQSAGVVPFDVTALGVDFAVGGSVKWLCGGPGAGWLYVRPGPRGAARADVRRLAGARAAVRVRAGARVRRRSAALPHRHAERPGALRGDRRLRRDRGGRRRADPRALARAHPAPDRPARRRRLRGRLAARARRAAAARSLVSTPDHAAVPQGARRARDHLRLPSRSQAASGSARTSSTREDELRLAVSELADIVATGAYERHAGAPSLY